MVVFDWMLSGAAVAAQGAGVPAAALVHCPYPFPVQGCAATIQRPATDAGLLGATRDRAPQRCRRAPARTGLAAVNKARAEQALQPLERLEQQLLGARRDLHDDRGRARLLKPRAAAGERALRRPRVRAIPARVARAVAQDEHVPARRRQSQHQLYEPAGARSAHPRRARRPAGQGAADRRAGARHLSLRIPSNARTTAFIPHRSVFPHAALVITHAGWQTINAALADGVPLLCIPDGRDQPDNAAPRARRRRGRTRAQAAPHPASSAA